MTEAVIAAVLIVGSVVKGLQMLGWIPETRGTQRWKDELEVANRRLARVEAEKNQLERTRSLRPVLEALDRNNQSQAQVLDKLASFNGTLTHLQEGLSAATEGLKVVTGLVMTEHLSRPPK